MSNNETILIILGVIGLFVIAFLLIKYVDGDFSYEDKVVDRKTYTRTKSSYGRVTEKYDYDVLLIQRRYHSGRVKMIKQVFKYTEDD